MVAGPRSGSRGPAAEGAEARLVPGRPATAVGGCDRCRAPGGRRDAPGRARRSPPRSRLVDRHGQGLAEYALILALIAIVAIVALVFLGGQISTIITEIAESI
jgi:pilus assembly protein Flp/PilA